MQDTASRTLLRRIAISPTTHVLLADDHTGFRELVRLLLTDQPAIVVAGEAEDGLQALELVETIHPDIVLMDIVMPHLNGLQATSQIRQRFPEVKVVILSTYQEQPYVREALKVGAVGYVLKRAVATELSTAIQAALEGKRYLSPPIAAGMEGA